MAGRVTRNVKIEAEDPKRGMTALELMTICSQASPDMRPTVEISLKGLVKAINLKVEVVPD